MKPVPEKTPLDLVRTEIRRLMNQMSNIESDMTYIEPFRRKQEYRRLRDPIASKLHRLQNKRTHGEALLRVYAKRIETLTREYLALRSGRERLVKILKLYRDINHAQGNGEAAVPTKFATVVESVALHRERIVEIQSLLHSYRAEIQETRRAMSGDFEQQEARFQAGLDRLDADFAEYLDNRARGDEKIIECRIKLADARAREADLARGGRVNELLSTMTEFMELASELSPEQREYALR